MWLLMSDFLEKLLCWWWLVFCCFLDYLHLVCFHCTVFNSMTESLQKDNCSLHQLAFTAYETNNICNQGEIWGLEKAFHGLLEKHTHRGSFNIKTVLKCKWAKGKTLPLPRMLGFYWHLSVSRFLQKIYRTNLHEILRRCGACPEEEPITFWNRST